MVVAFVGFVGGWTQQILGVDSLLLSGVVAASIVTFFTFLPSFLFIFMGAPFIESTQNNLKFTAPLTAFTAAVVGVILSLALFFAMRMARGAKSTPVTCQPAFASVITFVPVPQPRSMALPAGWVWMNSRSSGGEMPLSQGGLRKYQKLNARRRNI